MTRSELAFLSQAHAVAMSAMVAPETGVVPVGAAAALETQAVASEPGYAVPCTLFLQRLRGARGQLDQASAAGRDLRDYVARAMAYVPPDAGRVDIHG